MKNEYKGEEMKVSAKSEGRCWGGSNRPVSTNIFCRIWTELSERLRSRRGRGDTSEDDEGLPRSPCCNSPTATEGLLEKTAIKNHPTKSHSTCSDGSLLSMGSSDIEEESFGQQSSKNSSKVSLHEKKPAEQDSDWELGPSNASAPLNHSAAHHRVAVRPKRTHGAPRRNRIPPVIGALPTTPEVNEDLSLRSVTPDVSRESITELYSKSISMSKNRTEIQLKCSSLPPGLAPPGSETNKLSRSRSSASSKSQDTFSALGEEDEDKDDKKSDSSIFARLFPRRSAKKKKSKQENVFTSTVYSKQTVVESSSVQSTLVKVTDKPKSGPASRQRVLPIDIPPSPDQSHRELEAPQIEKPATSPLQLELESHLRQRLTLSLSTSPPKLSLPTVEVPQKSQEIHVEPINSVWSVDTQTKEDLKKVSRISVEDTGKIKTIEENKSRVKIAGLSSLQQRVIHHNDDDNFKSLTDFTHNEEVSTRQITKSHSFKTSLNDTFKTSTKASQNFDNCQVVKTSSSMDSIKNLKVVNSFEVKKESDSTGSSESLQSVSSAKTSSTEFLDSLNMSNGITISGPSHTSVVSVSKSGTNQFEDQIIKSQPILLKEETKEESYHEEQVFREQVSITKIQLKRETVHVSAKETVPEFLNVHLNKIDAQTPTNVVLTANLIVPKRVDDNDDKPKNVFNFDLPPKAEFESPTRKFSQDDIEIIDKDVNEEFVEIPYKNASTPSTPNVVITSMTPPPSIRMFKKHTENTQARKTSLVSVTAEPKPKLSLRTKSNSLDFVDSLKQDEDSQIRTERQKVLSTTDLSDNTVMRRKSLVKQRQDEEPELMKVFARRSLKVKDGDELSQQVLMMVEDAKPDNPLTAQENNKENHATSPTVEERKKPVEKPEPLIETKFVETTEVTLRKPINNKIFAYQQRTISVNIPKTKEIIADKVQKKNSFSERPKTEISDKLLNKTWLTTVRKDKEDVTDEIKKITHSEIITEITTKSDFINEDFPTIPKNFNQRKAEWEKRAQEALKKNVP